MAAQTSITASLWFECPCGEAFGLDGSPSAADLQWYVDGQQKHAEHEAPKVESVTPADQPRRAVVVMCPRCKHSADATVGVPWLRPEGHWEEWVTIAPHLHGRTGRSTCRPRGFGRRARPTAHDACQGDTA